MAPDYTKFCAAAVFVWAIASAPALAQETTKQSPQQNQTQAPSAPGTNGVTAPLGPPGPRFQVNLTKFEVFDETGFDFFGSDEAIFIVRTDTYNVETREFGSLDSDGTVHKFDPGATCAFPATDTGPADERWSCDPSGAAAPISFFLEAWDQDGWLNFCAPNLGFPDVFPPEADLCGDNFANSSIIGQARVTLDLPTLMSRLPQVGQSYTANVVLQGGCFRVACSPDDIEPLYNVDYTVTRVPDSAGSGGGLVVDP